MLDRYDTVFIDSITVAGRLCFQWSKGQPEAHSEKTGKPDVRGAYGLHGREMIAWLTHLQHTRAKNVWFVGILDEKLDDFNRKVFQPQIDGSKTGLELPGIVDQVITMAEFKAEDGTLQRGFVCQTLNPWGYPAKDRSGRLDMVEAPHLGRLMEKIRQPATPAPERLSHAAPPAVPTTPPTPPPTERTSPMSLWNDFNDAQPNSNVIPKGTLAKVRLTIRPGGFDDPAQGWTGGYATRGSTGAVYLNGEFTVLEGPYAKRKIWSLIGLYSPKGPDWANMGRSLVRGMLNSARGISDKDNSAQAQAARRINGFADLDGIEFVARIDIGTDINGEDKNEIRAAVTPDHRDYAQVMGHAAPGTAPQTQHPASAPQHQAPAPSAPAQGHPAPAAAADARAASARRARLLGPSELGRVRAEPCDCVPARNSSSSAACLRSAPATTRWASRPPARARRSCCRRSPATASATPMPRPACSRIAMS